MQLRPFDQAVVLADATRTFAGDAIVDLHLWNEQLPLLADGSLRFARRMNECLAISLRELAIHVAATRALDGVDVIRANMGFGTAAQVAQLVRISGLYGFEPIPDPRQPLARQRLHRLGENILISLMVLARNGLALRRDTLGRSRVQVFMSRQTLLARYGDEQPRIAADRRPW